MGQIKNIVSISYRNYNCDIGPSLPDSAVRRNRQQTSYTTSFMTVLVPVAVYCTLTLKTVKITFVKWQCSDCVETM